MQHFLSTQDWTKSELDQLLLAAKRLQQSPWNERMRRRSIALLFFNPSLRTRTSFELGMHQLGGHAVVLQPGKDAWGIAFEESTVMDGSEEEHMKEVAGVLSRYCDLIAVRAFPKGQDWLVDRQDLLIHHLAKYSQVPVINMETILHPCQELAFIMALQQRIGSVAKKRMTLTWTWHPKALNTAVANSALLIGTRFGMDVTLLIPEQAYALDEQFMQQAHSNAQASGGSVEVTTNIEQAYRDADVVYAKSWGALPLYGQVQEEQKLREPYRHFIVDEAKMSLTNNAVFSHCLPLRRNVKATDAVMDSPQCMALEEAENRLHVQKAIMLKLLNA
ncbi:MAG: N-acetylornithine carbamoyltransferase [Xanthomonadales bacterium]|nr:N-acetylornithine carbamoyltransferase [Xanthomonadales bacterium]